VEVHRPSPTSRLMPAPRRTLLSMAESSYQSYRPARRPGTRPQTRPRYRVLVHRQYAELWTELPNPDRARIRVSSSTITWLTRQDRFRRSERGHSQGIAGAADRSRVHSDGPL